MQLVRADASDSHTIRDPQLELTSPNLEAVRTRHVIVDVILAALMSAVLLSSAAAKFTRPKGLVAEMSTLALPNSVLPFLGVEQMGGRPASAPDPRLLILPTEEMFDEYIVAADQRTYVRR